MSMEREWLAENGLPGRPWYRSLYAAPDPGSGYSPWMLPLLRQAVEDRDSSAITAAIDTYARIFERLERTLGAIERDLRRGRSRKAREESSSAQPD
jgi:N-acetylated-alpha-linked acidic dipeptidase